MQPIDPNKPMTGTLTAQEWNSVMAQMNEAPHRIARPILDKLMEQFRQQQTIETTGCGYLNANQASQANRAMFDHYRNKVPSQEPLMSFEGAHAPEQAA